MRNPFRYFKTSPEIIRLAVMMYIRFPLSLRNVEDLLHERGIDVTPPDIWTGTTYEDRTMLLTESRQPKGSLS